MPATTIAEVLSAFNTLQGQYEEVIEHSLGTKRLRSQLLREVANVTLVPVGGSGTPNDATMIAAAVVSSITYVSAFANAETRVIIKWVSRLTQTINLGQRPAAYSALEVGGARITPVFRYGITNLGPTAAELSGTIVELGTVIKPAGQTELIINQRAVINDATDGSVTFHGTSLDILEIAND